VEERKAIPLKALIVAFLVAGTSDIAVALIQYTISTGNNPIRVLIFIASGVFGRGAYEGSAPGMAALGLIFHYCIAFIWTFIFYKLYPLIALMRKNRSLTGLSYGLIVWLGMNLIVVPLSNTPELPFSLTRALTGILILMVAIGTPLSFIIGKYYSESEIQ